MAHLQLLAVSFVLFSSQLAQCQSSAGISTSLTCADCLNQVKPAECSAVDVESDQLGYPAFDIPNCDFDILANALKAYGCQPVDGCDTVICDDMFPEGALDSIFSLCQSKPSPPVGTDETTKEPKSSPTGGDEQPQASPTGGDEQFGASPTGGDEQPQASPTGGDEQPEASPTGGDEQPQASPTGGDEQFGASPTGGDEQFGASPTGGDEQPQASPTGGDEQFGASPTGGDEQPQASPTGGDE